MVSRCEHGDDSLGSIKCGEFLDCLRKFLPQAVGVLVHPLAAAVKRRAESSFPARFGHYISKLNLLIHAFFSLEVVAAVFCDVMKERIRVQAAERVHTVLV